MKLAGTGSTPNSSGVATPAEGAGAAARAPAAQSAFTLKQRAALKVIEWFGPALINFWCSTLRVSTPRAFPAEFVAEPPEPAIYVCWHQNLLPLTWYLQHHGLGTLISQHFDGEWIARIAARMGYIPVRGSSTRGGYGAMYEMTAAIERGIPMTFALDGPRGPRFKAKGGPIYLARMTGAPIYTVHLSLDRQWLLHTWDELKVPKPFAAATGVWEGPFRVAPDAEAGALEAARREIEDSLNRMKGGDGSGGEREFREGPSGA
jgi:lysophospholipid acyltransferase (LPLAT)-like uncharacterized protein